MNWGVFAPRLGFAWDMKGDGKTSVRGSIGVAYDYLNIQAHLWTDLLRKIASGWRLAPIYRIQSGSPLYIIARAGVDSARNGTAAASQPADQLLPNVYGDTSGGPLTNWFNISGCNADPALVAPDRCAFAAPPTGRLGNIRPRTVVGPKLNVTNSFRPQKPNTSQNNQFFGVLRLARDPRIMQFALKYTF